MCSHCLGWCVFSCLIHTTAWGCSKTILERHIVINAVRNDSKLLSRMVHNLVMGGRSAPGSWKVYYFGSYFLFLIYVCALDVLSAKKYFVSCFCSLSMNCPFCVLALPIDRADGIETGGLRAATLLHCMEVGALWLPTTRFLISYVFAVNPESSRQFFFS